MYSVKTAQSNVSLSLLSKLPITVPPVDEQKIICDILFELDDTIKQYGINLQNLDDLKKKLTNDFLSGKLTIPKDVL